MRFVPRVNNRTVVHCIDACLNVKEIGTLRELIVSCRCESSFRFDAEFPCPGEDLPRDKERHDALFEFLKRDCPRHEIVIVTPVTMPVQISIIFVKQHPFSELLTASFSAALQDTFAGSIVCDEFKQTFTFGRGILWMCMVIVKACAVHEYVIALNLSERESIFLVAFAVSCRLLPLIRMVGERVCPKTTFISKRVFPTVVPHRSKIFLTITLYQLN